jgi:tetratricopeptide (TPR) repeat protein
MKTVGGQTGAGISLFLFLAASSMCATPAGQAGQPSQDQPEVPAKAASAGSGSADAQSPAAPSGASSAPQAAPDHAAAYYHFVLARRYEELAGVENRSDLVDRAIAEYKAALAADPGSLFVKTQLAELYYRLSRVGDAIREAEAVLQVNPDEVDAHRLLASIYLHSLSETEAAASSDATLRKAITQFEAVTRLDPSDTDSLVALGRLYRLTNQNSKAEEALRKAIGTDPGSRPALQYLAQLYLDQGNTSDAIATLEKIPAGEMDPAALVMLGQAYMQSRDYDKALAAYTQALEQDPDNQELRRGHAEALMAAGKTAEARTELQKILRTDPNDAQTWLRLGHLDRVEGKFDEAREELTKAKNLQSDNAEITYEQVLLEETTGNDDKAVALIQGLLKDSEKPNGNYTLGEAGNRAAFLERLGMIYRNQEKYDQALGAFRQILELGPSQTPHGEALMIDTLRLARRPTQAIDEANAAVAKYPKDRQLAMLRASLLGEQGKVDEAIAALNSLLTGGSSDFEVELNIAQVYSTAKRYSDAEAAAQKALSISIKPDDQENAHFILGSIYERQKRYDLAEAEFKKVLASDPLRGDAANYLGYMLADRGVRLEESVKYIQQALQSDPNNGAYLDSLGWAYLKMHRPDLAEGPLERAAHLITNDPTILEHLGNLHLALGKPQAAEQEWERALKEWPQAQGSDFDADEAASLQKKLDDLKFRMAKGKPPKSDDSPQP